MMALEDLTPGGSEFYECPQNCAATVKSTQDTQHRVIISFKKRMDASDQKANALKLMLADVIALRAAPQLEMRDRICTNCNEAFYGTAFAICMHCGRYQ